MFNPCYPFTAELLDAMTAKEVRYYVRSTYARGTDPASKEVVLLMSHYHELPEAERHYNAIAHDPHRKLYNAAVEADLAKLKIAASQPAGYKIYSKIIVPESEQKATRLYKEETKRYLYSKTNWDLKGRITIYPKMFIQLGELYARISHQGDTITIKFEDIENS